MFRRGEWRVGWLGFEGQRKTAYVTVLARDSSDNVLLAKVTTGAQIPSAVVGYAYGCILIVADSGLLYTNTGGATSCTFSVSGFTSGSITSTLIGSGVVTPVKMSVKNIITGTAGASFQPAGGDIVNGYLKISTIGQTFAMTLPAAASILLAWTGATGAWFDYQVYNGAGHSGIIDGGTGTTIIGATAGTTVIPIGGVMSMQIVKTGDGAVDAIVQGIVTKGA